MQTVRDQLAAAFPLHFQRICELTYACVGRQSGEGFLRRTDIHTAERCLEYAFLWRNTEEGVTYWNALAEGARR